MSSPFQNIDVVDDVTGEILRHKTPGEHLAIANRMWNFAREMVYSTVLGEHPDWTEAYIQQETARRISQPEFEEEWYKKIPLSLFL
jgi:Rv0078B-related antitoxin